jgi:hypothetical protein
MESWGGARPFSLVAANDKVIPAQFEEVLMARLVNPLGVENGLVEPCLEAYPSEKLFIARTLP